VTHRVGQADDFFDGKFFGTSRWAVPKRSEKSIDLRFVQAILHGADQCAAKELSAM